MKVDFDPSLIWVTQWQERNLIVFKGKHGEKQNYDFEVAENWIVSVWPKIQEHYTSSEIYNCDRRGFTIMLYQKELCPLKTKNFLVARNQKSNLPSYLLPTLMAQTNYSCLSSENLLICTALEELRNSQ